MIEERLVLVKKTLAGRATDEQQQQQQLLGIDEETDSETIDFIFSHELRRQCSHRATAADNCVRM